MPHPRGGAPRRAARLNRAGPSPFPPAFPPQMAMSLPGMPQVRAASGRALGRILGRGAAPSFGLRRPAALPPRAPAHRPPTARRAPRSFAELWRLKVHYRAPPDVRGSGRERGHGTELAQCPRCGKQLKPGKHHVGCAAGRTAPRQASKRSRSVGGASPRLCFASAFGSSGLAAVAGPGFADWGCFPLWRREGLGRGGSAHPLAAAGVTPPREPRAGQRAPARTLRPPLAAAACRVE